MIDIGPARESEVVLAFLKAEIDYRDGIQQTLQWFGTREELIEHADIGNDFQNAARAVVLDSYRGYLTRRLFFIGFPTNVTWRRCELESADFQRLMYIANERSWDENSRLTRSPQVVADRIAR